jgi:hypothetical protein
MVARGEVESEKLGRDRFITAEAIETAKQRKTSPGPAKAMPGGGKASTASKAVTATVNGSNAALTTAAKAKKRGKR